MWKAHLLSVGKHIGSAGRMSGMGCSLLCVSSTQLALLDLAFAWTFFLATAFIFSPLPVAPSSLRFPSFAPPSLALHFLITFDMPRAKTIVRGRSFSCDIFDSAASCFAPCWSCLPQHVNPGRTFPPAVNPSNLPQSLIPSRSFRSKLPGLHLPPLLFRGRTSYWSKQQSHLLVRR